MGEKVCPNCRMPLPENARFCAECGSRIDITVTRKELGESSLGVESGLKIERNAAITSPFYEKCDSLKDKIVNPELKPLPEKKKFVFRSWDDIKNSTIETGKLEFGEKETEESENGGIEQNIEENIEQLNEEAESENYDVTIEKSTIEEVNMEESDAEEPNIEELNTEEPNIEEAALETAGCTVERYFLREENDFAVTKDLLNAVHPGTNMVFLCQPNNPTGQLAEPALVEALLRRCEAVGAVLAVDECFLDFLPEGEGLSARHLLKNSKKLIILKAFTKLYGMAGVRLGYCLCSDTELLARMRAAGQPWAVSSLAQAAGIAALDETEYVAKVRALIEAQRPVLADGLRALGLRVIEGRANYLLFRAPEALGEALRRKGAVLRSCGNYPGLDASWYRTAVRTENENRQLLALLAETLPEVAQ